MSEMPLRICAYSQEHGSPGMGSTFHSGWYGVEDPGYLQTGRHEAEYIRADLVPAWHDAPTCPGLWLNEGEAFNVTSVNGGKIKIDGSVELRGWRGRWFGPIPADEVSK